MLKQLIDIQCYNMKTKKLKRVPQYAFGADAISNWGNMSGVDKANVVTQGVGAVGSMIGNATSGKKPTAAGVIGGIGSGAAMGASIGGPWGAVIGGAIGDDIQSYAAKQFLPTIDYVIDREALDTFDSHGEVVKAIMNGW